MKHEAFRLAALAPSTDVLEAFLALGRKMATKLAMVECRNITERMVLARVQNLIEPQIREAFAMQVAIHGELDGTEDRDDVLAFTDDVDTAIEALFEEYRSSVTMDFMMRATIGTVLHRPVARGPDECEKLAVDFAKDVWRVLIHDGDEENETHVLSTAKILSAVGIVEDDLKELLGDMTPPTQEQQAATMKALNMLSMNDIFNSIYEHNAGQFDEKEVKELFDMATDANDALALSGLVPLGLNMDAAPTLRLFNAKYGANAPTEFVNGIRGAPYEEDATDSAPDIVMEALDDAEETDPDMRVMMGLPPLPAAPAAPAAPHSPHPAAGFPPGTGLPQLPAPPGPIKSAPSGTIDKRVFTLIRQHVKRKDEDIAAGIGVSRQTFINYADPAKKAAFVASDAQSAFLVRVLTEEYDGILEALTLLGVVL